jgi:hypothetical protein
MGPPLMGLDMCRDLLEFNREDSIVFSSVSTPQTREGQLRVVPIVQDESSLAISLNSSPSRIGSDPFT